MTRHTILPILILLMTACSSDEPGNRNGGDPEKNNPKVDILLNAGQKDAVNRQNDFAFRLFENVITKENNVISPLSVSMAMSMAANGAGGDTYAEICRAIGLEGAELTDVNTLNRNLVSSLPQADRLTDLSIANSLWISNDFAVSSTFRQDLEEHYDASVGNIDLTNVDGIRSINKWVSDHTDGHINNFMDKPLAGQLAMVNAIYFKSIWTSPFSKKRTKGASFHNEDGSRTSVDMMNSGPNHKGIITDDGATIARMTYGNRSFMFIGILPPEGVTPGTYLRSLDGTDLEEWDYYFNNFDPTADKNSQNIEIGIPRFKTASSYNLIPVLQKLGVNIALTPLADFSGISTDSGLCLTDAIQKATIEVDEEGVTATASTGATFGDGACVIVSEKVIFDRPFLYLIRESSTGAILFIGNVSHL